MLNEILTKQTIEDIKKYMYYRININDYPAHLFMITNMMRKYEEYENNFNNKEYV